MRDQGSKIRLEVSDPAKSQGVVGQGRELAATDAIPASMSSNGKFSGALRFAGYVVKGPVVQRILIHLDRQSSPADFRLFGDRVVPFYNYLQAAFVLQEDGRIPARAVLRVTTLLEFDVSM